MMQTTMSSRRLLHTIGYASFAITLLANPAEAQTAPKLPLVRVVAPNEWQEADVIYICAGPQAQTCRANMDARITNGDYDTPASDNLGGLPLTYGQHADLQGVPSFTLYFHTPWGDMGGGNYWQAVEGRVDVAAPVAVNSPLTGVLKASGELSALDGRAVTGGQMLFQVVPVAPDDVSFDFLRLLEMKPQDLVPGGLLSYRRYWFNGPSNDAWISPQ